MRLSFPSTTSLFPVYLTPSLPFGRRKTSTDSNNSSRSADSDTSTGVPDTFLTGHTSAIRCSRCLADLAPANNIISKGFTGRHGRAYLVAPPASLDISSSRTSKYGHLPDLPNTYTHKPVARNLVTGVHTVCDISCTQCGSMLGWKYVAADDDAQRYKVGKFILETKRVCRTECWEGDGVSTTAFDAGATRSESAVNAEDQIDFDSQDEDECEDLFMGIWTPQIAAKRRRNKTFARSDD